MGRDDSIELQQSLIKQKYGEFDERSDQPFFFTKTSSLLKATKNSIWWATIHDTVASKESSRLSQPLPGLNFGKVPASKPEADNRYLSGLVCPDVDCYLQHWGQGYVNAIIGDFGDVEAREVEWDSRKRCWSCSTQIQCIHSWVYYFLPYLTSVETLEDPIHLTIKKLNTSVDAVPTKLVRFPLQAGNKTLWFKAYALPKVSFHSSSKLPKKFYFSTQELWHESLRWFWQTSGFVNWDHRPFSSFHWLSI